MEKWIYGLMEGWMVEWMYVWIDWLIDIYIYKQIDKKVDRNLNPWMIFVLTDRCLDGRMDGCKEGWIEN